MPSQLNQHLLALLIHLRLLSANKSCFIHHQGVVNTIYGHWREFLFTKKEEIVKLFTKVEFYSDHGRIYGFPFIRKAKAIKKPT